MNYLIIIKDDQSFGERHVLTVYALDEGHAQLIGELAAKAMYEGFHKSPEYFVDSVTALD